MKIVMERKPVIATGFSPWWQLEQHV